MSGRLFWYALFTYLYMLVCVFVWQTILVCVMYICVYVGVCVCMRLCMYVGMSDVFMYMSTCMNVCMCLFLLFFVCQKRTTSTPDGVDV